MTKKRTNTYKEFVNEVCGIAVRSNKIKDIMDLNHRWYTEIAPWSIRMDFIPANWYYDLKRYIIKQNLKERSSKQ